MMQAKIDLMTTRQDLLLRLSKETNATVQDLNRKHKAGCRKSEVLEENEIDESDVTILDW